ncbi:hypothetical protein AB3M83_10780 [Microbacterium sp. 179-B 1A2 NHS]|uniref:MGH1-like glycoside hydrolase domain-containing protein n=1 Tax=Microbacterium sp. 179-B 1A2 NHS TaxID=3142383 RepID=UPI0039A0492C
MASSPRHDALARLRAADTAARAGVAGTPLGAELATGAVGFAAIGGPLEARWDDALGELSQCIRPIGASAPVLNEGGPYDGCWIESTGTINVDVLTRFAPRVARDTLRQFADHQREDGMIPYKVTPAGPGFSQIQMVTPLARTVWRHYLATGDAELLRALYDAMVRHDAWLVRYRDTRGTGGVEAFCTFDTGHDLSPRFWFAPDRALHSDARYCDPTAPLVPYVAPDLTANVACQREYLAVIARELGQDPAPWQEAAAASRAALYDQCFVEADGMFYDRDRSGAHVAIASDVLARVLACEIGDGAFFAASLRDHLMNTRRFLAHYGFTTIAMDDPRFDADATRNSWGGPVNFLAQLRAPDAFERHGHVAELSLVTSPVLSAVAIADRFPQCLDPWSGAAGYTEVYSPSILWYLDALERTSGVMARPDGTLWLSGMTPTRLEHGAAATAVAFSRRTDAGLWEIAGDDEIVEVFRDGEPFAAFPRGWRVVVDADGRVSEVVGLAAAAIGGVLRTGTAELELVVAPNEVVDVRDARVSRRSGPEFVPPVF